MHRKGHSNSGWVRLLKQVSQSDFEYREYCVKRIRYKSYYDTVYDGVQWDHPYRTKPQRSWKTYRKAQFK